MRRNIKIAIFTTLLMLIAGEIFLRKFVPISASDLSLKKIYKKKFIPSAHPPYFSFSTEVEEGLPGINGKNKFTTNNFGFRGDNLLRSKPGDEIRIFMVGGSTTECFYLDDSQVTTRILQDELNQFVPGNNKVTVYNAGKAGDRSDDHISMIVHRIVHLEPDILIVFSGINDLFASLANPDYHLHLRKNHNGERIFLSDVFKKALMEFQLFRRIKYVKQNILHRTEEEIFWLVTKKSNYKEKIKVVNSKPVSDLIPKVNLEAYENNLKTIAGVAQSHKIKLIFMTQATNWNSQTDPETSKWQWLVYFRGIRYRADLMDEALESLNKVMRKVSTEYGISLYDLVQKVPKSSEYFYDDVHFNIKGARKVGKDLASFILRNKLISAM